MRFRQVHLDFHTSGEIRPIGRRFSKEQFQAMLKEGHVDSITVFAKCHHGWAYHPTEANEMHPGLSFDLLGAMIEAAHEIDVKTPVYISAGLDEKLARRHTDWLMRKKDESFSWTPDFMRPGYHQFCMNSPYLDVLIKQTEEVVRNYDADGIFLDIVGVRTCYCQHCVASLREMGKDPHDDEAVQALGEQVYANYTRRINDAIHAIKPGMEIFHNGGHILRGRRDLALMNTHIELESLPTGDWGYDHFPLSVRYTQGLGMEYLGMTGKFHTWWGEFGGFKHPNALRYEMALSIANGAKCSIGDQLHPEGLMDPATYKLIGQAYSEVQAKEAWCDGVRSVADVALLSFEAVKDIKLFDDGTVEKPNESDVGAIRMLLEGKILFDVIDQEQDFGAYKVIILPDDILLSDQLRTKLEQFFRQGGKVLATGRSGLDPEGREFAIDLGVRWLGPNKYRPSYFVPHFELKSLGTSSFVFYSQGQNVELAGGRQLGHREDSYFNRETFTFSSHQHTPNRPADAGPGMVESANGIYFAWNVFDEYATYGSLVLKESVLHALNLLLPDKSLDTNLPAQGIVTVQHQTAQNRYVNHLLYASPVKRGQKTEIIEDILPVYDVQVALRLPVSPKRVYLAPQMTELPFEANDGAIRYTVPKLECHQMVVIE